MRLVAAGATDRGPRQLNQDAHFLDPELGLFIVADGMGGHRAGEIASRLAVDVVVDFIRETRNGSDITWPFPLDPSRSLTANRLAVALRLANSRVYAAGERNPAHAGMGTTIVAVLVEGVTIAIGHVGDSRAYVVRDRQLVQVTEDHTWLNAIGIEAPQMASPMRHILTSGIGMGTDLTPSVAEDRLVSGERWLICTDGVHGCLDAEALMAALGAATPERAAEETVRRAVSAGTSDNATAVVLNVE